MGQPHQSDPTLRQRLEPDQSVMQKFEAFHSFSPSVIAHWIFFFKELSVSHFCCVPFYPDPMSVEVSSAAQAGLWHQEPIAA